MRSPRNNNATSRRVPQRYPILFPVLFTACFLVILSHFFGMSPESSSASSSSLSSSVLDLEEQNSHQIITPKIYHHVLINEQQYQELPTTKTPLIILPPIISQQSSSTNFIPTAATTTTSLNHLPPLLTLDVTFHRLSDPLFHLLDAHLSDEQILELIHGIQSIWKQAGIDVRIDEKLALRKQVPDRDRLHAYLFYVIGHPIIKSNSRRTQILPKVKNIIIHAYSKFATKCINFITNILPLWSGNDEITQLLRKNYNTQYTKSRFVELFCSERILLLDKQQQQRGEDIVSLKCTDDELIQCLMTASSSSSITINENKVDNYEISPQYISYLITNLPKIMSSSTNMMSWFAYQYFYFQAGLSWTRIQEFAEAMRDRPMLFLHYAIGRDISLTNHDPVRTKWEHANTISIYPIPLYHDMNGRGSTVFMDVIFRTGSCYGPSNYNFSFPGQPDIVFPTPCRWGVRAWEKHQYTMNELIRMVSHELGHCLSLEHTDAKCRIFSSSQEAPLMQQQRVFALKSWTSNTDMCKCLREDCNNCECSYSYEEVFRSVGEARKLTREEIDIARKSVMERDNWSSLKLPSASVNDGGVVIMGHPTEQLEDKSENSGALLSGYGSKILFMEDSTVVSGGGEDEFVNGGEGWISTVRWKASFAYCSSGGKSGSSTMMAIRILSYSKSSSLISNIKMKSISSQNCDDNTLPPPKFKSRILMLDANAYGKHYEFKFDRTEDFYFSQGDVLGVEMVDGNKGSRIRFAQALESALLDETSSSLASSISKYNKNINNLGVLICASHDSSDLGSKSNSGVSSSSSTNSRVMMRKVFLFNFDVNVLMKNNK
jgi:hypothetical protein